MSAPGEHPKAAVLDALAELESRVDKGILAYEKMRREVIGKDEALVLALVVTVLNGLEPAFGKPFSDLLQKSKELFPSDHRLQALAPPAVGHPPRTITASDGSLIGRQLVEVKNAIGTLRGLLRCP
jgi:hypothetical protein